MYSDIVVTQCMWYHLLKVWWHSVCDITCWRCVPQWQCTQHHLVVHNDSDMTVCMSPAESVSLNDSILHISWWCTVTMSWHCTYHLLKVCPSITMYLASAGDAQWHCGDTVYMISPAEDVSLGDSVLSITWWHSDSDTTVCMTPAEGVSLIDSILSISWWCTVTVLWHSVHITCWRCVPQWQCTQHQLVTHCDIVMTQWPVSVHITSWRCVMEWQRTQHQLILQWHW